MPASDLLYSDNSETPHRNLMQEIKRLRNEIYNIRGKRGVVVVDDRFQGSRLKTELLMWTHLLKKKEVCYLISMILFWFRLS